ncbi:MAG: type IV secretion system DNA-binding domain-containing protein [Candidatus Peregrinibacteria bacterium]|nr:type IV secretion system DNA-binding domain-containing protein [Candidatus Peregrinibacteria bacterium]
MKYFQVVVPQGDGEKKKERLYEELLVNLHKTAHNSYLSMEFFGYEQYTYLFFAVPDNLFETIEGLLYATFPDCEIKETSDYVDNYKPGNGQLYLTGARIKMKYGDIYPFKTFSHFEDDSQSRLFSIISKINSGEQVWVQFVVHPIEESAGYHFTRKWAVRWNNFKKTFNIRDRLRAKDEHSVIQHRKELAMEKLKHGEPFEMTIRCGYLAKTEAESHRKLHAITHSFYQYNETDIQEFKTVDMSEKEFLSEYKQRKLVMPFLVGPTELATLYHLPNPDIVPHIVHVLAKKSEAPQDLPKIGEDDVSLFGITNYHNNFDKFGIKRIDRRRHLYAVGKSGSGKSKLLELLIYSDIMSGKGVAVLDPHGDLVDNVLEFVPEHRIKDVIYFDPSDVNFPISFNPLENVAEEYKMQVTIGFLFIFKKLFGSNWTDRLEHVLRYTVLALLDSPNTTVLSILKMLTDKNYRQTIVSRIKDNVVKNFWVSEFAGWSEKFDAEAITPLLNKVGQFVATNMIRNIIGQPKNKINIREIMDGQKILLMKVSKGLLGEENSGLMGAMIITKMYQAAMSRADMKEEDRKDFYFYVDEFQNFATDTFAEILSEARKYRLDLTIAHQYMGQLTGLIQKTVFGNVGSMISFRVGADDADVLAQEYNPIFKERDIINLGVREFYCKMSINGEIREAFSARTMDVPKIKKNFVKEIIENSRKTYCEPRAKVEETLAKWDESGEFANAAPEGDPEFEEPLI